MKFKKMNECMHKTSFFILFTKLYFVEFHKILTLNNFNKLVYYKFKLITCFFTKTVEATSANSNSKLIY